MKAANGVDMDAARKDFESGMSTRAMGLKYGCCKSTITRWSLKYGWQRKKEPSKSATGPRDTRKPAGKPVSALTKGKASANHKKLCGLAERLMDYVGDLLDDKEFPLTPKDIKSLTGALLDVRTLLNAVSPLEEQEQRLKLAALQRDLDKAREDSNSKTVTVRFESPEIEELSV